MATKSVQQKQEGEPRWLVRHEHGETFGPVHFETLMAWARDGRLAPASMVSKDAETWTSVAQLPGLGMDWMAEVSPGVFYGPIHLQALEGLLKDGTIAPGAPLFVRSASTPSPHPAEARAEAAEKALAECIEQAEQAQTLLTMQVTQLTVQLAERDAHLQRVGQREADFNMLQLLTQSIISAQETGTQQILDAVVDAQAAALADVRQELAQGRQSMLKAVEKNGRAICDVVAALAQDVAAGQERVRAVPGDTAAALTQQLQHLSGGIREIEQTLAH
ncbi:MAG: hypothetical protein FWH21_03905, partial [Kiritimatiellaeota bacterium]|nr:hypothetical protein [Kiritimatiellota bacterium]